MIIDPIRNRWSPYSFSDRPVEEEKFRELFEAASLAPSSMNEQPWMFIHATKRDGDKFDDFASFLEESNRIWASSAWALIVTLARTRYARRDRLNKYAFHDTGLAVGNLLAQATYLGISVHQMGGFFPEKVKEYFSLPAEVEPVTIMAIGYSGDGNDLNEDLKRRHNSRKPRKNISEFVFRNKLGNPAF
jgi:nitroreductase